jgi:hypothetical protein
MSDVRAILACLANEEVARVFASIVLHGTPAEGLALPRQRKAVDALVRSGLITRAGDHFTLDSAEIKSVLAAVSASSGGGVRDPLTRWLDADGRIAQYPRRGSDRVELLQRIGEQVLDTGERVSEAEVNARLDQYTGDIPTLRRYLIVHGVLSREPDGSAYWRA